MKHAVSIKPAARALLTVLLALCLSLTAQATVEVGSDGGILRGTVTISDTALELGVGVTTRLRGTANPEGNTITWSTNDTDIIRLSNTTGTEVSIATLSPGQATVTARVGLGVPATCTIRVSGVRLSQSSVIMQSSATEVLNIEVFGMAERVSGWEWSTSNANVVTVSRIQGGATLLAVAEGTASVSVNGGGYSAVCQVTVIRNDAGSLDASLTSGILRFSSIAAGFRTRCRQLTGEELSYITGLSVEPSVGTLYDGYVSEGDTGHGVSSTRRYYSTAGAYRLDNITFVPRTHSAGTIRIAYTGYSVNGKLFNGDVIVTVDGEQSALIYASQKGEPVKFRAEDFSAFCLNVTNRSLQYVTFTLPDAKFGTLYYNYYTSAIYESAVSAATRYYRTVSPSIDNVSFVPAAGYSGSFDLAFTGSDTEGASFNGSVRITVTNNDGNGTASDTTPAVTGDITYEVERGKTVDFRTADFTDLCDSRIGETLSYITLDALPAETRGVLYYGDNDAAVGVRYFRTGENTRRIANLNFTAGSSYTGTFLIPFTGYGMENGETFTGNVAITVTGSAGTAADAILYRTTGPAVALKASDITAQAEAALSGVASIRLYSPPASSGRLVRNFISPGAYVPFDAAQTYTPEEVNQIWFLPKSGFQGTASVTYVARDAKGTVFSSVLRIEVNPPVDSAYFNDLHGRSWAVPAADFFRYYNILNGTSYSTFNPDGTARRGQYITVLGRMFGFPTGYSVWGLSDVRADLYYAPYFAAAAALGIVTPTWDNRVYPDAPITREDAAVYLYRCLKRYNMAVEGDFNDLRAFIDWNMIDNYAMDAMASMVRMGVFQGDEAHRLNPYGALTRLQMAAILYRAMT